MICILDRDQHIRYTETAGTFFPTTLPGSELSKEATEFHSLG